ncbi:MAG: hypothetical protein ACM3Q4_06340 [Acidobacteriota bacterium]
MALHALSEYVNAHRLCVAIGAILLLLVLGMTIYWEDVARGMHDGWNAAGK